MHGKQTDMGMLHRMVLEHEIDALESDPGQDLGGNTRLEARWEASCMVHKLFDIVSAPPFLGLLCATRSAIAASFFCVNFVITFWPSLLNRSLRIKVCFYSKGNPLKMYFQGCHVLVMQQILFKNRLTDLH